MSVTGKEFVLTHVVNNITSMDEDEDYYSPTEEHFNVPWKMNITRKGRYLSFYLMCERVIQDKAWAIHINCDFKISTTSGKSRIKSHEHCYFNEAQGRGWGWPEFIKWSKMEKHFMIDGKLLIEVHVKINKMTGITWRTLQDFNETMREVSDAVLIVQDRKFYVSKMYLARQSSYFKTLFMGNFNESGKSEVSLVDINPNDFQRFLELIHSEVSAIDDETVDGILRLADMYDAQTAVRRCEEFLLEKSEKPLKEKLQLATRYKMEVLKTNCLSRINTLDDIRSVMPGDIEEMDSSVAKVLLRKSLSLQ